jgi:hypothetical protein
MRLLYTFALFAVVCLVLMPQVSGCKKPAVLTVAIPHNFSGRVQISCEKFGDDLQTTAIDATGNGVAPVCSSTAKVVAERDGQAISVDDLQWAKTGDGIPVGITFSVR